MFGKIANQGYTPAGDRIPVNYNRAPTYDESLEERDVAVPMRDGVNLSVDVFRPKTPEKVPALLAFAVYNKDLQGPDVAEAVGPQPAWAPLWSGWLEAGDTRFFVSRGYAHVIGAPRNFGKSGSGGSREWDSYDLIEWIAQQPWCDGNVGMVGISGFGAEQFNVAKQQPPHLKAIFPFDPRGAYGKLGSFREEYPGGVLHTFRYLISHNIVMHQNKGAPGKLPPDKDALWQQAMANRDYKMYPHIYNVLTMKGQHQPQIYDLLINPFEDEKVVAQAERDFDRVQVPVYTGSGWYGYSYKTHLNGTQNWYSNIKSPKKLALGGPAHLERPFHSFHNEILRWHDHWLKGIDTGVLNEPPVKFWVMGANEWYFADEWPLREVEWTRFYLSSWERLSDQSVEPASAAAAQPPDVFAQMPLSQTTQVQRLRYMTDPLPHDVLVAGPSVLTLFADIDQPDTNWIVSLKDVGPDYSTRTVREGERQLPTDLPEREVSRGWLKASHRAIDEAKSKPGRPWHPLTREAQQPVEPGVVNEYAIEILSTANLFKAGHRICVDVMSMDVPTGVGGATNAEYVAYHICSSSTTVHRIHRDAKHPSHLLLPIISQR
jgi:predicted acyl esterase